MNLQLAIGSLAFWGVLPNVDGAVIAGTCDAPLGRGKRRDDSIVASNRRISEPLIRGYGEAPLINRTPLDRGELELGQARLQSYAAQAGIPRKIRNELGGSVLEQLPRLCMAICAANDKVTISRRVIAYIECHNLTDLPGHTRELASARKIPDLASFGTARNEQAFESFPTCLLAKHRKINRCKEGLFC